MPEATATAVERTDSGVAVLTLSGGDRGVVVLNRALIESLDRSLDDVVSAGDDLPGFVLASEGRVFVAGADLGEIVSLDDAGLMSYLSLGAHVFGRIASLPCRTVAAINGAALGGGLELAMHCDDLIACSSEKPYAVGLPEAGLGICPGWGGTNMLPARMGSSVEGAKRAIRMAMRGKPFGSVEEAAESGVVAEVVGAGDLLERAVAVASGGDGGVGVGATPRFVGDAAVRDAVREALAAVRAEGGASEAGEVVLACVERGLDEGWEAATALERKELCRLRHTEAGRAGIEAFFAKSGKKKS